MTFMGDLLFVDESSIQIGGKEIVKKKNNSPEMFYIRLYSVILVYTQCDFDRMSTAGVKMTLNIFFLRLNHFVVGSKETWYNKDINWRFPRDGLNMRNNIW